MPSDSPDKSGVSIQEMLMAHHLRVEVLDFEGGVVYFRAWLFTASDEEAVMITVVFAQIDPEECGDIV